MYLTDLNEDIILNLILTVYDKINLNQTCKYLFNILDNQLHDFFHKCHEEIENEWNIMANNIMFNADTDIIYQESNVICCSVIPDKLHYLEVKYLRNPRDVNILSWYEDNKQIGYTML